MLETIITAIRSLGSNKMRSLLSMLGVIIGVGAVIAVVSIASGTQEQVTSRISSLGSNLISIDPGISLGRFGRFSTPAEAEFTLELGEAIADYSPSVVRVVPKSETSGYFVVGDTNYRGSIIGTTLEYQDINNYYPATGKYFSQYDLDSASKVIVLGSELVEELYGEAYPIGSKISFTANSQSNLFTVVGVMEEKDSGLTGNLNRSAYIPITSYLNVISNGRYVNGFVAQAASSGVASEAVNEIEYLLTKYFQDEDKFNIMSQDQLLDTISEVTGAMTLMLGGIAAISLLVGGIGIMNIMLVSVTERTREIGIMKALGAKRRHIQLQFLIEALTLSVIGGIVGVGVGVAGAWSVAQVGGWPLVLSPSTLLLALVFSLVVGIFFGMYPAIKASKLDPVVSLSYE